jgi:hypothetical protein
MQFLKKNLKIMQAVKTSRLTNLHIVYSNTPKCLYFKKANLIKELEAIVKDYASKAYLQVYLDAEDSFEDELDYYVLVNLALLKSTQYASQSPYRTWNSNWECMLYDGMYMTDDEFLSNFQMDRACIHQLKELVNDDEVFSKCWGKQDKRPVMLHIMVFLKYLGSYGNEASLHKSSRAMGISKVLSTIV